MKRNTFCLLKKSLAAHLAAGTAMIIVAGSMAPTDARGQASNWGFIVGFDHFHREIIRSEIYLSGEEFWFAKSTRDGLNGDMQGGSVSIAPPFECGLLFDLAYRTGDLDGPFTTQPLMGMYYNNGINGTNGETSPDGSFQSQVFAGQAWFERDEFEFGTTLPLGDIFFFRGEYYHVKEEGKWTFDGNEIERQEYKQHGLTVGVGGRTSFPLCDAGTALVLSAFFGLGYFHYEHDEIEGGSSTDWDGFSYVVRTGAEIVHPLSDVCHVYAGAGYEYWRGDADDLNLEVEGPFIRFGLSRDF